MECLVTGAAGFVGSHLCERLLRDGNRVVGIDCLTDYYDPAIKQARLDRLAGHRWFQFRPLDLATDPLDGVFAGVDWVFHLAAMPGLVKSWTHFPSYQYHNIQATQRLLEALKASPVRKMVYASTSSVYGRYASGDEALPLRPSSPYGITKLAAEQLCRVYHAEFGVPSVTLRYFSVFGPGQRPDMAYSKFIDAVLGGREVTIYGDGRQVRGNTYVEDCVDATVRAADAADAGEVFNVGGGELVNLGRVLDIIQRQAGRRVPVKYADPRPGDQLYTGADVSKIKGRLGWTPTTGVEDGLAAQIAAARTATPIGKAA